MPNPWRLPGLVITATTLAGCVIGPTANPTSIPATAQPTSSQVAATTPPPTPSPAPFAAGCAPIDSFGPHAEVSLDGVYPNGNSTGGGLSVGHVFGDLTVTRITERSGPRRSIVPPPPAAPVERGQLLGGVDFVTFPFTFFDGHQNPQAMSAATVTLSFDGSSPIDLPARFVPGNKNFDQVEVSVPDVSGSGTLSMAFEWADPCFDYAGSIDIPVDVVARSATAGCELEDDPYFDQLGALLKGSLKIGSTKLTAVSPLNDAKFGPFGNPGIDAFILYAFDPKAAAIRAAPGVDLRVVRTTNAVSLGKDLHLSVWTRASVGKAVTAYPPTGEKLVLSRTATKQADGSFRLAMPRVTGRYVAGLEVTYDTQCSSGTLWSMVNIDVAG